MSLQRKKIRDAVVNTLLNKTICADRVFASRVRPTWRNEFPLILVYANDEAVENWAESPREYKRSLTVSIEILARQNEKVENLLDEIGERVEYEMSQDHTKGELCEDTLLQSAAITIDKEGENLIASLVLTFALPYYSLAVRDLDSDAGNFDYAEIEWDTVGDTTGTIHAIDVVSGFYDD